MSAPNLPTPPPDEADAARVAGHDVVLALTRTQADEVLDSAAYFAYEFDDRDLLDLVTALRAQLEDQ